MDRPQISPTPAMDTIFLSGGDDFDAPLFYGDIPTTTTTFRRSDEVMKPKAEGMEDDQAVTKLRDTIPLQHTVHIIDLFVTE